MTFTVGTVVFFKHIYKFALVIERQLLAIDEGLKFIFTRYFICKFTVIFKCLPPQKYTSFF